MRADIAPGGTFPRLPAARSHEPARSASCRVTTPDPHARVRPLCPRSTSSTWSSRRSTQRSPSRTRRSPRSRRRHHTLLEFRASVGAQWTFLSDPGRTVQQDVDIQAYTDPENDPMIPHTLVLEPGLVVHSI